VFELVACLCAAQDAAMSSRTWFTWLLPCFALLLLAGSLRLFRLGDWSLAGDETATFNEVDSLLTNPPVTPKGPIDYLPRLIPLAHGTLWVGYELFGRSEFGCRLLPALLGSVNVVLLYSLLRKPLGLMPALAAALLAALWPEHLLHSQENRFYIPAECAATLCMGCGAQAAYKRSLGWMLGACIAAIAAVLVHTTLGLLQIGLVVGFTVATVVDRRPPPWALLGLILTTALATRLLFVSYLMPIYKTWNADSGWGYGPIQSAFASVAQVGIPTLLLACLGTIFVTRERCAQGFYWLTWVGLWVAVSLFLPLVMVYQPSYAFAFATPVLVLAGLGAARVYERLQPAAPAAALGWIVLVFLLNTTSVLSHYADGSRHDFRSAAWYLADHFRPGDRVAAMSPAVLSYYTPVCREAMPVAGWNPLPDVEAQAAKPGRLWIVISSGRSGKPEPLAQWLAQHAQLQKQFRKKRLDYYDYVVEVYLRPAAY
jgi:Dolichyl-phosphate-mannose-protein mannosyltransferase